MIRDALTVAWKEWQEYLQADRGRGYRPWRGMLLIAAGGGFIGWQLDPDFGRSLLTLVLSGAVGVMLVGTVVPDSFAGERERHTLETLLASRLPDGALLLGKYLAAVSYGWTIAAAVLGVGVASANLIHGPGGGAWVEWEVLAGSLLVTLLAALLIAGFGLHVSLYAPTARQAHQRFGLLMVAVLMSPAVLASALPAAWLVRVVDWIEAFGVLRLAALATLAALAAAAALVTGAAARFHRARMIA